MNCILSKVVGNHAQMTEGGGQEWLRRVWYTL